jgi:hypothetical protein
LHSIQELLLGESLIIDISQGTRPAFAIGTEDPGGWFLDFGTTRMQASPWLGTTLHAHYAPLTIRSGKVIARRIEGHKQGLIIGAWRFH